MVIKMDSSVECSFSMIGMTCRECTFLQSTGDYQAIKLYRFIVSIVAEGLVSCSLLVALSAVVLGRSYAYGMGCLCLLWLLDPCQEY